ncbi:MAG TPA: adenine deaminase, partial [Clostridiaceae bacterium]|nr:adenine deaminase [Clostridiaceae bacterium]
MGGEISLEKEMLVSLIKASSGEELCDLVLKNAQIADVFSGEIIQRNIAVKDGYIVGFGDEYKGAEEIDLKNAYVAPGLIDAHIHIESTLATPKEFSRAAIKHGITSVVMDPHEIANVMGTSGLDYMLKASENLPVDFMMMLPSCVPATEFETSGAILHAEDLKPFYRRNKVAGLAEVMDLNAVRSTSEDMMTKLLDANTIHKTVDGHGSGLSPHDNNIYRTAGITTDHECTTLEEAKDRLEKGFYIHIREGSVAKNFDALIPLVTRNSCRRFTFCTDDIYISDLNEHGSIDDMVRRAIKTGLDPVDAIRMATLNPSECYGLKSKGAVAPGYEADFLIVDDLAEFVISSVYKKGQLVYDKNEVKYSYPENIAGDMPDTMNLPDLGKR